MIAVSRKSTCAFFHGIPFLFDKSTDRQIIAIYNWVFGRHFLTNEEREPSTSRKTTNAICCQ